MIRLIVCTDLQGNIGRNNNLLFYIPKDMKFFKEQTIGYNVLMGYNTWLSLPEKARPLPLRRNIVVSLDAKDLLNVQRECWEKAKTVITRTNLDLLLNEFSNFKDDIMYVIGGASIYNYFIDKEVVDEAYITLVHTKEDADVSIKLDKLMSQFCNKEILDEFEHDNKLVQIIKLYN